MSASLELMAKSVLHTTSFMPAMVWYPTGPTVSARKHTEALATPQPLAEQVRLRTDRTRRKQSSCDTPHGIDTLLLTSTIRPFEPVSRQRSILSHVVRQNQTGPTSTAIVSTHLTAMQIVSLLGNCRCRKVKCQWQHLRRICHSRLAKCPPV